MQRYRAHIALFLVWFLISNVYQTIEMVWPEGLYAKRIWLYMAVHALVLVWCIKILWEELKKENNLLQRIAFYYRQAPIPLVAKRVFLFIFILEVWHISEGAIRYPFDDVGMFRYAKKTMKLPKKMEQAKYYYYNSENKVQPVDLRKQHIFFAADLLGAFYNNEFTFTVAYTYRNERANFEFLAEALKKEAGIDSLWVGVQTVDFGTGEVSFDPDIASAVQFNDEGRQFYGPLYIPEYQRNASNWKE